MLLSSSSLTVFNSLSLITIFVVFNLTLCPELLIYLRSHCFDKHREVELANENTGLKNCSSFPANQTLPMPPNGWACDSVWTEVLKLQQVRLPGTSQLSTSEQSLAGRVGKHLHLQQESHQEPDQGSCEEGCQWDMGQLNISYIA